MASTRSWAARISGPFPLAVTTGGNGPDIKAAPDLVEAIGPVAGRVGASRKRPDTILADGGYDSQRPTHQFKRLAVRWDRHLFMHPGFAQLGAALICWRRLARAG